MSVFLFDDDIDTMLADSPHSMTFDGVTKKVWLDDFDDQALDGNGNYTSQIVRMRVVTYKTNHFPTLKSGDTVTINGQSMKLKNRMAEGDGALTKFSVGA